MHISQESQSNRLFDFLCKESYIKFIFSAIIFSLIIQNSWQSESCGIKKNFSVPESGLVILINCISSPNAYPLSFRNYTKVRKCLYFPLAISPLYISPNTSWCAQSFPIIPRKGIFTFNWFIEQIFSLFGMNFSCVKGLKKQGLALPHPYFLLF